MKRRQFITLVGGAAAWPLAARAQQPDRLRRIGVLSGFAEGDPQAQRNLAAFTKALQELGWADGRNIRVDYRSAAGNADRMRTFAKELVSLQPDLIVGTPRRSLLRSSARPRRFQSYLSSFPIR